MSDAQLFKREEVLEGLVARRAHRLFYLIEAETALQINQTHMFSFGLEDTSLQDKAFFEALSQGRELPTSNTPQELERHAPHWGALLPDDPRIKAILAHLIGEKYELHHAAIPQISKVLGLNDEAVGAAYQRHYKQPLESIYVDRLSLGARLKWTWNRLATWLENLPPFWAAFFMILTETVGGGTLALPIAVAKIGALGGIVLLVILGLLNILTITYIVESVTRSGSLRFQGAYLGRVVGDFLGGTGAVFFALSVAGLMGSALLAYMIGFGRTIGGFTGLPDFIFTSALFVIVLYMLSRGSLNTTISAALVIGTINIVLLLIISLIALTHFHADYIEYSRIPFIDTPKFDPSVLQIIFGVVLAAYFGHTSVGSVAVPVLRRDPSGRALLWGSISAQAATIVLYVIWVIAINGAIAPSALFGERGTVLVPLQEQIGAVIGVFGMVFILLSMGLVCIYCGLALFSLVRERLPQRIVRSMTLPSRSAQVRLASRGIFAEVQLNLVYLGLRDKKPLFRLDIWHAGKTSHHEQVVEGVWDASALIAQQTGVKAERVGVVIAVEAADGGHTKFKLITPMKVSLQVGWDRLGLQAASMADLPEVVRPIVTWMTRQHTFDRSELMAHFKSDEQTAQMVIDDFLKEGFLRSAEGDPPRYQVRYAPKGASTLSKDIWLAIQKTDDLAVAVDESPRWYNRPVVGLVAHKWGRFAISCLPVVAIYLIALGLMVADLDNFSEILGLLGTLGTTIVAGIFSVLLLASSRRHGDLLPQKYFRWIGAPLLLGFVYAIFFANIFIHAFVIWSDLLSQGLALAVGILLIWMTWDMLKKGALSKRLVLEVRQEEDSSALHVVANGEALAGDVKLVYGHAEYAEHGDHILLKNFPALREVQLELAPLDVETVKIWAHRIKLDGMSEGLPVQVTLRQGEHEDQFDLSAGDGQVVTPLERKAAGWRIVFSDDTDS